MSDIDLLHDAREALISGRPEDALAAITRFHELGPAHDSADTAAIRHLLEELGELAEAGRQGVAAARRGVEAAIELAAGGVTYDSQGQRARADADRRKPLRF